MKKNDYILIAIIIVVAVAGVILFSRYDNISSTSIVVTVDGKLFGTYSLKKDQEIEINDTNYLIIRDGIADMIKANCPDQICVKQKPISKNNESIICLPNKVIVEVVGGEKTEFDAVVN